MVSVTVSLLCQIFENVFPTEERTNSGTSTIFLMDSVSTVFGTCFKIGISVQTEDESIYKNTSIDTNVSIPESSHNRIVNS